MIMIYTYSVMEQETEFSGRFEHSIFADTSEDRSVILERHFAARTISPGARALLTRARALTACELDLLSQASSLTRPQMTDALIPAFIDPDVARHKTQDGISFSDSLRVFRWLVIPQSPELL